MKNMRMLLLTTIGGLSIATACSDSLEKNDSLTKGVYLSNRNAENLSVFLAADKEAFKSKDFSPNDLSFLLCNSKPKHFFTKMYTSDFNIIGSEVVAKLGSNECIEAENFPVDSLFNQSLSYWEKTRVDSCGRAAVGSTIALIGFSALYKTLGRQGSIRMFEALKEGASLSERAVVTKVLLKAQIKALKGKSLNRLVIRQELSKQLEIAGHILIDEVKYSNVDDAMAAHARFFEKLLEILEVKYLGKKVKKVKFDIKPNTSIRTIVHSRDAGLDLKTNEIAAGYLKKLQIDIGGELPANFLISEVNWKKVTNARKVLMKVQHADLVGDAKSGTEINVAVQELAKIRKKVLNGTSQEFVDDSSFIFEEKELNGIYNGLRAKYQNIAKMSGNEYNKVIDVLKIRDISFAWILAVGGSVSAYFGKDHCKQNPFKARKNAYEIQISEPKKLVPLNVELNIAKTFAGDKNVSDKFESDLKYRAEKTRLFLNNFNKNSLRSSKVQTKGKERKTKDQLYNLHF